MNLVLWFQSWDWMTMRCQSRLTIKWKGVEITERELSIDELLDVALGINYTQGFDLDVDMHSVDVDDVAPPTVKCSDAKHHASLLSTFLLDSSLHFGVNEIFGFQKLVGSLDKMTFANLGRQHQISLNSYFKSSWKYLYLFGVKSYYFIQSIVLKLVVYVFKLIMLMILYSFDCMKNLCQLSY